MALTTGEMQMQVLTLLQEDVTGAGALYATSEVQTALANASKQVVAMLPERYLEKYATQLFIRSTASTDTYTLGTDVLRVIYVGMKFADSDTNYRVACEASNTDRRNWEWNSLTQPSTTNPKYILLSSSVGAGTTQTLQIGFMYGAIPSRNMTSGLEVFYITGADAFGDGGQLMNSDVAPLYSYFAASDLCWKDDLNQKAQDLYGRGMSQINEIRKQFGLQKLPEARVG